MIVDTQRRDRAEIMKELVNIRKNLTIITSQAENQSLPKCPICDLPYENPARKMVCFNVCGHCLCQSWNGWRRKQKILTHYKKYFLKALFLNLAIVKMSTRKVQEFWYSQRTVNVTFAALLFSSSISFPFSFNDINLQLDFHDFLRVSISSVSVFIFKSWQSRAFRYWSFNFSYFSASARRFSDSAVSWSFIECKLSNFPCKVA